MLILLEKLLDALSGYFEEEESTGEKGAVFCPYHKDHHTRGGEAAFPFVYLGKSTGQDEIFEKGLVLADWLARRQNPDGSWDESPGTWKGTTVFQLMALSAVLDTCGSDLSGDRKILYESAVANAAEWVKSNINMRKATTNYVASGAAGLALADKLFPEKGWDKGARRLARMAAEHINEEGLIRGEGRGKRILKKIYVEPKGIDMGYGLEMTLSSLGLYLVLFDDEQVSTSFHRALQSHLYFIYPDGGLDNSIGSRGYKWTMYGSKTTHGSQMALAYGALSDPRSNRALKLTTECLRSYVNTGLLPDGPHVDQGVGISCLYPTILKACNLAFALKYFSGTATTQEPIPCEESLWVKKFTTLNSFIVKRRPWMATISGYNCLTRFPTPEGEKIFYVPGGGSLTLLFHDDWGLIQAATQLDYQQVELLHVPEGSSQTYSFTPRIIIRSGDGTAASNAYAKNTKIKHSQSGDRIVTEAWGRFFSPEGQGKEVDSSYRIRYTFSGNRLTKEYQIALSHSCSLMEVVEPVVLQNVTEFHALDNGFAFERKNRQLLFHCRTPSGHWAMFDNPRITSPLPSLMGVRIVCGWDQPDAGEYEASTEITIE